MDPHVLNLNDNFKILNKTSNLEEIMDGCFNIVRKRVDIQQEKQIGETFGSFDVLKDDDEYSALRLN